MDKTRLSLIGSRGRRSRRSTVGRQNPGTMYTTAIIGDANRLHETEFSNLIIRNYNYSLPSTNKDDGRRGTKIINLINIRKYFANKLYPFSIHRICTRYESLDYEVFENHLMLYEERAKTYPLLFKMYFVKWMMLILIGVFTAVVACTISVLISRLTEYKFELLSNMIDTNITESNLYIPLVTWIFLNAGPVVFAACLICYLEPLAAGSGIPSVKCYLNGVAITDFLKMRTLLVKIVSLTCSMVGGLSCGKEGPMVHVGAAIASALAEWKVKYRPEEMQWYKTFNIHNEKREFVSAGAASGLAAAFGGSMGGVLFCLEDGASFWSNALTFHTFFSAVVTTFAINIILSTYNRINFRIEQIPHGLVDLGYFDDFDYSLEEIPIFIMMGIFGGCIGALWIFLNSTIQSFRKNYVEASLISSVIETFFIASVTATVAFITIYASSSCSPLGMVPTEHPTQVYCEEGELNVMASIWFKTPENTVKSFLHDNEHSYSPASLGIFVIVYYVLSFWTSGMAAALGVVVAGLLTGAAWGRLVGHLYFYLRVSKTPNVGKFALIGACAQLGGLLRTTISLTVIIMESTGNTNVGVPVVITLMCAKWTAESFNRSVYDYSVMFSGVPFLWPEPPPYLSHILACEIMSESIINIYTIDTVENVFEILESTQHNGFPVVDVPNEKGSKTRKLRGIILRKQLIIILKNKIFVEYMPDWHGVKLEDFNIKVPDISDISLTETEKKYYIDFRPYMNPSPYTILYDCTLSRLYQIFRALGLRHLPVVDDSNHVIGMVTRKDIAKYRFYRNILSIGVEELYMSTM